MLPIVISAIESPEDRDSMTEFYHRYKALLYNEARKHLSNTEDVEDIVSEALTRIIDRMSIFRDLAVWQQIQYALTTVRNLSYILLKRNNYITFVSFESIEYDIPADERFQAEKVIEKKMFAEYVKEIWQGIDLEDRILLEQKYILRWKDDELATTLGIQPQSVRMRLTRAKRNIMEELNKKGVSFLNWF